MPNERLMKLHQRRLIEVEARKIFIRKIAKLKISRLDKGAFMFSVARELAMFIKLRQKIARKLRAAV